MQQSTQILYLLRQKAGSTPVPPEQMTAALTTEFHPSDWRGMLRRVAEYGFRIVGYVPPGKPDGTPRPIHTVNDIPLPNETILEGDIVIGESFPGQVAAFIEISREVDSVIPKEETRPIILPGDLLTSTNFAVEGPDVPTVN